MTAGSMPMATEIFQEGIRIPPVRLVRGGRIDEDLLSLLLRNVRTPDERLGDLRAQMASIHVGRRRIQQLVEQRGREEPLKYASALREYTEKRLRAALRRFPTGEAVFEDALDGDGIDNRPIPIRVRLVIGSEGVTISFDGTAPQVRGPLNANFAVTLSACAYAIRCIVPEEIPFNDGCFVPLEVRAPEGTIVNARPPAAVCGGNVETSQRIVDAVLGALGTLLEGRLPAASQGTMNNLTLGGADPVTGEPFTYYETMAGGAGAGPDRPGTSGVHTHMTNTRNTPIEALEHAYPLRVREYRLRKGSGGDGRKVGGEGIIRTLEVRTDASLTLLTERRATAPWGASGGAKGEKGRNTLIHRDGREEALPAKVQTRLACGESVRIESPGGGGWGTKPGQKE